MNAPTGGKGDDFSDNYFVKLEGDWWDRRIGRINGVRYGRILRECDHSVLWLDGGRLERHFVRRYLERRPQAPLSFQQVDPLIRELVQYRDLIYHRTKEMEP
jgi:hypothetical protein